MPIELKPCPFCGGEAKEKYIKRKLRFRIRSHMDITHFVYIKCNACGVTTAVRETRENAAETWNRRADSESPKN